MLMRAPLNNPEESLKKRLLRTEELIQTLEQLVYCNGADACLKRAYDVCDKAIAVPTGMIEDFWKYTMASHVAVRSLVEADSKLARAESLLARVRAAMDRG